MDKILDSGRWVEGRERCKPAVQAGWVVVVVVAGRAELVAVVVVVGRAELAAVVVVVGLKRMLHIKYV